MSCFQGMFFLLGEIMMNDDLRYMKLAMDLAAKGKGWVNPNPMVGAVIVKNQAIIGQGYHRQFGGLHAEREALANCQEDPSGATIYVTLEPCCHWGKTPPCTEALIEAGIQRVVVACLDPNLLVAGKGVERLKAAGISVDVGILADQVSDQLRYFFHYIRTGRPYVVCKYAMTLDGKIASRTGDSQWITGPLAREQVHRQRHEFMAIMVGINTVLQDDPLLTCRLAGNYRQPVRIICDRQLRLPLDSQLVRSASQVPTLVATSSQNQSKIQQLQAKQVEVIQVNENESGIDLSALLSMLGERGIDSLYVEGGAQIHGSLVDLGLVNEFQIYLGNQVLGGVQSPSPIAGQGFAKMNQALTTNLKEVQQLGKDIFLRMEVE